MEPSPSAAPQPARRRRITQPTPSSSSLQVGEPPAKKSRGRPKGSKTKRDPPAPPPSATDTIPGAKDWSTDADTRSPSSLVLLIDWLGQKDNFDRWKFGAKGKTQQATSREAETWMNMRKPGCGRTALAIQLKIKRLFTTWKDAADWKNYTGNGGGQRLIDDASDDRRDDVERDVKKIVLRKCPEWTEVDPIFRSKDGGTASLRADSSQLINPALEALVPSSPFIADEPTSQPMPRASVPVSSTPASPGTWRALSPTESEQQDREREMLEVTAPSGHSSESSALRNSQSISDRQQQVSAGYSEAEDGPDAIINLSAQGVANEERVWREKKEDAMGRQERYREEKLELERERVKAKSFGERMRAAEILVKADVSLSWDEAFRKAGEMMRRMDS